MNKILFLFFVTFAFASCASLRAEQQESTAKELHITSFEECVAAGNPILRSMPPKCVTKDKFVFVQEQKPSCKNLCGNGSCEQMVCMAVGCPCAETAKSCPQDCKGE